jgi:CRISPR-associated protein Cas1
LRRTQHRISDDLEKCIPIARNLIAAKLSNSRTVLQRALRDHYSDQSGNLSVAIDYLSHRIKAALHADSLDSLRGIEGESAVTYFAVFNELITLPQKERGPFVFKNRSRRPPLDPINALLSFLYVMLAHDCRSACESVGLDPQMGFLHRLRPGRQSLALDLMEELRAYLADRLCLSLINRKQVSAKDFEIKESGAVLLKDDSRKTILAAWQERKSQEITHPFIQEKITIGLLPQIQARLLARHLRGDLDAFPAFLLK